MKRFTGIRVLLAGMLFILVPMALAQQTGQNSTGNTANSGTNTGNTNTNNSAKTNPNTSNNPANTSISTRSNSEINNRSRQQQRSLFISGAVLMEDGTPPPMGAVVVQICGATKTRRADVAPNGNFGFQAGAATSVFPDASESAPGGFWSAASPSQGSILSSPFDPQPSLRGCELRAELSGYLSTAMFLDTSQSLGILNAGTIFLYPIGRVTGTTVSTADLAAPRNAKKTLAKGEKALKAKKLSEAEKQLNAALAEYPAYATAWFRLGQVYEESGRAEEARNAFHKTMQLDDRFVPPYVELARLAALEFNWQEAAELSGQALKLNPIDYHDAYYIDAVALFNLKQYAAAEERAKRLQLLDSSHRLPMVHLLMAAVLRQKGDSAGEADQLRAYLQHAPKAADADSVRTRLQKLEESDPNIAMNSRKAPDKK